MLFTNGQDYLQYYIQILLLLPVAARGTTAGDKVFETVDIGSQSAAARSKSAQNSSSNQKEDLQRLLKAQNTHTQHFPGILTHSQNMARAVTPL